MKILHKMFSKHPLILLLSFLLTACSINSDSLTKRLLARGPLSVSSENPYIAANLFLTRESEKSPVIKGFLEQQGNPSAIEVEGGMLSGVKTNLYYLNDSHFYIVERINDLSVITGPFPINLSKQDEINSVVGSVKTGETVKDSNLILDTSKANTQEKSFSDISEDKENTKAAILIPKSQDLRERSTTQQAEISPRGDLVHYVTFPGETLSVISRWYTGDKNNVGKLARVNNLKHPDKLVLGDTIIVPSYLLKNKTRLTKEAMELMR